MRRLDSNFMCVCVFFFALKGGVGFCGVLVEWKVVVVVYVILGNDPCLTARII